MYGLIFDMDGVLVDSARPHFESWRQLGVEIHCPVTDEAFVPTFGLRNQEVIEILFGRFDMATVERYSQRKEEIYRDLIRNQVPAMDGAAELVRACFADGFRVGIGSSGPSENVDLVVDSMGLAPYLGAAITARHVSRGKPHPEVFLTAAEALGVPPGRCAVVEDAPAGIEAALSAGAVAIALAGSHPEATLVRAHRLVRSLRELTPAILRAAIDGRARA